MDYKELNEFKERFYNKNPEFAKTFDNWCYKYGVLNGGGTLNVALEMANVLTTGYNKIFQNINSNIDIMIDDAEKRKKELEDDGFHTEAASIDYAIKAYNIARGFVNGEDMKQYPSSFLSKKIRSSF